MHYEFKADGRAGGSSPTHLSETFHRAVLRRCLVMLLFVIASDGSVSVAILGISM